MSEAQSETWDSLLASFSADEETEMTISRAMAEVVSLANARRQVSVTDPVRVFRVTDQNKVESMEGAWTCVHRGTLTMQLGERPIAVAGADIKEYLQAIETMQVLSVVRNASSRIELFDDEEHAYAIAAQGTGGGTDFVLVPREIECNLFKHGPGHFSTGGATDVKCNPHIMWGTLAPAWRKAKKAQHVDYSSLGISMRYVDEAVRASERRINKAKAAAAAGATSSAGAAGENEPGKKAVKANSLSICAGELICSYTNWGLVFPRSLVVH